MFKSAREIECIVGVEMSKFLEEQLGEHPQQVIVKLVGDAIIVRLKQVLPPAEKELTKNQRGVELIKELKDKLIEKARPKLEMMLKNLTRAEVINIYSDINLETWERIVVFTLDKDLEKSI